MRFTKENIKYCLLCYAAWEKKQADGFKADTIPLSGLYNWSEIFKGVTTFPKSRERMSEFNLLHVNMTGNNLMLMPKIWKCIDRNKTKVIMNVDYSICIWHANFKFPDHLLAELDKADYIFAVEEEMADLLTAALKRDVRCIPHPVAIDKLKSLRTTQRGTEIAASIHTYDTSFLMPSMAIDLSGIDRGKWVTTAIGGNCNQGGIGHLYDNFIDALEFPKLMAELAKMYAMIESYTIRSYGRLTVEAAALGVPVIGANVVSSQRRCFPALTTEVSQPLKTACLLRKLVDEPAFWTKCARRGADESEYYSFANCEKMMLDFLNS